MAEYSVKRSEAKKNYSQAHEADTQADLNVQLRSESEARQHTEEQKFWLTANEAWKASWENGLRECGFDPTKSTWENLFRLSVTNPDQFDELLNSGIESLSRIDDHMKQQFGDNYKRKAGTAILLYSLAKAKNRFGWEFLNRQESLSRILKNHSEAFDNISSFF